MPTLEELLFQRQQVPSGAPTGVEPPPQLPSLGRSMMEGGIDTIMGLLGVGPDTQANQVGQMIGAGLPVFRVGGKVLRKAGKSWQWLDDTQAERVNTKLDKAFEKPITINNPNEMSEIPVHVENEVIAKTPPPKPSGNWGGQGYDQRAARALSRSKLNTTMVSDIRSRGRAGEPIAKIMADYPEASKYQIHSIIRGDAWNWVK